MTSLFVDEPLRLRMIEKPGGRSDARRTMRLEAGVEPANADAASRTSIAQLASPATCAFGRPPPIAGQLRRTNEAKAEPFASAPVLFMPISIARSMRARAGDVDAEDPAPRSYFP